MLNKTATFAPEDTLNENREIPLNIDNILDLADFVESLPKDDMSETAIPFTVERDNFGFNMGYWTCTGTKCASVGCIGGAAQVMFKRDVSTALGITLDERQELCYPTLAHLNLYYNDITPAMAAKVLRNLALTGRIDWSVVREKSDG